MNQAAVSKQQSPRATPSSTPSPISGAAVPNLTQDQQALLVAKKEMAEALGFAY
jgi:hypothetical protein